MQMQQEYEQQQLLQYQQMLAPREKGSGFRVKMIAGRGQARLESSSTKKCDIRRVGSGLLDLLTLSSGPSLGWGGSRSCSCV